MTSLSSSLSGSLSPDSGEPVVGFDAGWKIVFRRDDGNDFPTDDDPVTLRRANYQARIRVESDDQFRAPTFDVLIDGLLDEDFGKLADGRYAYLTLFLGWRDLASGFGAAFANVADLLTGGGSDDEGLHEVLTGRILAVERTHGDLTYTTRFQGVDARFDRMRRRLARPGTMSAGSTFLDYARRLCQEDTDVQVDVLGEGTHPPIDGVLDVAEDRSVASVLRELAQVAHGSDRRHTVPMFLRLDGLHVGTWQAPAQGAATHELTPATGLVESKPVVEHDPDEVPLGTPWEQPDVSRFDLTLLGRADIAVGDLVRAPLSVPSPGDLGATVSGSALGPLGDAVTGIFGGPGGPPDPEDFAVISVEHRLGPTESFVTRLVVKRKEDLSETRTESSESSDEAQRLAAALAMVRRRERRERRPFEVGLVRRQYTEYETEGTSTIAAQRVNVDEGLADAPSPNVPVNAQPADVPTRLVAKPYLTPFAFGGAGLVIPHYPGMRVVDLHYREERQNAVVAGCVWEAGEEPVSEPGDWWLCLPTGVTPTGSAPEPGEVSPPTGPGSHDLIDAAGGRAIEVQGFRIQVGGTLANVGSRPDSATDGELLISHPEGNARIKITTGGDIEIATDGDITFTANKITMNVSDQVEVS